MKPILQSLRSLGLVFSLIAASSPAFSATITSNGTGGGNWSSSAWTDANRTGTITTSIATNAVTGVFTSFTTELSIGSVIKTVSGTVIGTVASITDNTNLTLVSNAASPNSAISFRFQGVGSGDDVRIQGGDNISIDIAVAACASLDGANTGSGAWSLVFTAGSQLTVSGLATIGDPTDAGSVDMTNGGLLKVGGLAAGTGGATLIPGSGTVEFTGTTTIPTNFPTFNNLTVSGGTLTASQGLTINGNVVTGTGTTLVAGDFTHSVAGNILNNGAFNQGGSITTPGPGIIIFNGTSQQSVTNAPTGTGIIQSIVIDNPAGILLGSDITAISNITMTQGNIDLGGHQLALGIFTDKFGTLTYTSGTMIGAGSFLRWFAAAPVADGSVAGLFPVGTATTYRPIYVSAPGGTAGGSLQVTYNDAAGNTTVAIPDGGTDVITVRKNFSWSILSLGTVPFPAMGAGTYNIRAVANDIGTVGNLSDLRLTLANSVLGSPGGNTGTTASPEVNRINLSAADINGPNTFYIGTIDAASTPLPITLLSFTATPVNGSVKLDWETTSEINNDHFTIQRSRNAVDWESIKVVPGAINSSVNVKYSEYDETPYQGVSYYRLQQTDRDGKTSFSPVVSVKTGQSASVNLYPNPASDHIWITTAGSGRLNVTLYNNNGRRIDVPVTVDGNSARLDIGRLAAGTYFVYILQGGLSESRVVLITR